MAFMDGWGKWEVESPLSKVTPAQNASVNRSNVSVGIKPRNVFHILSDSDDDEPITSTQYAEVSWLRRTDNAGAHEPTATAF